MALQREPGRDRGAERLAVSHDVVRRDAEPAQIVVGADRVGGDAALVGPALRTAVAAIIEHEHAIAVGGDGADLAGAIGHVPAIAGEIEQRRLAPARRLIPGDQLGAVGRLEHDLLDTEQTRLIGGDPRAVGKVNEITMKQPPDDDDQCEYADKSKDKVQHGSSNTFRTVPFKLVVELC